MELFFIIMVIVMIVAILALIFFVSFNKLKKHKDRMDKVEVIINENLNKKLDLIVKINTEVKKVTGKKDYLKEYVSIKDANITNIEKDNKLDDAIKVINELTLDFDKLKNNQNFIKNINEIKKIDEVLVSSKILFNQNAVESNKIIKKIPNNIVAKLCNFKIKNFYNNNKNDIEDVF